MYSIINETASIRRLIFTVLELLLIQRQTNRESVSSFVYMYMYIIDLRREMDRYEHEKESFRYRQISAIAMLC